MCSFSYGKTIKIVFKKVIIFFAKTDWDWTNYSWMNPRTLIIFSSMIFLILDIFYSSCVFSGSILSHSYFYLCLFKWILNAWKSENFMNENVSKKKKPKFLDSCSVPQFKITVNYRKISNKFFTIYSVFKSEFFIYFFKNIEQ